MEDFISAAGDGGFIYISMGSSVKAVNMPEHLRQLFIETFAQLPYQVLWKWEGDMVGMASDIPSNVKLSRWLPQQDILGSCLFDVIVDSEIINIFEIIG